MTVTDQDFSMYAGDSRTLTIAVVDGDGAAVNLTGASIEWGLWSDADATTLLISKSTSSGITILTQSGDTLGKFRVTLAPADTSGLQGDYRHEAEVTDGAGNISTTTTGKATISASRV